MNRAGSEYLVHQRFRYEYTGPIANLSQRLVVVPPPLHGDQRLVSYELVVTGAPSRTRWRRDRFGNLVAHVKVPHADKVIEFELWLVVTRSDGSSCHHVPMDAVGLDIYRRPSPRTRGDAGLRDAAGEIAAATRAAAPAEVAAATCAWVHSQLMYAYGMTTVRTTAGEALAGHTGVCQDYAHVMVALCRLLGLAARYVSGHLLGEGGTHAWVEVLVPDGDHIDVLPWDPTHDCTTSTRYITVATGRDYGDVAPTSGTYSSPHDGYLIARRTVGVTAST
jgi:transglutaminase-like putative cysteine protease